MYSYFIVVLSRKSRGSLLFDSSYIDTSLAGVTKKEIAQRPEKHAQKNISRILLLHTHFCILQSILH